MKCFARREGVTYVCAVNGANGERYEDERSVHEWVNHWRESAAYDYSGSESEWLADLDEVITAARSTACNASACGSSGGKAAIGGSGGATNGGGGESRRVSSRWLTNADQLVRAGLTTENELNE